MSSAVLPAARPIGLPRPRRPPRGKAQAQAQARRKSVVLGGPMRRVGGERCDSFMQREWRHRVAFGREQPRGEDAPLRSRPQKGQTARPADGAEQIVNKAGDEARSCPTG